MEFTLGTESNRGPRLDNERSNVSHANGLAGSQIESQGDRHPATSTVRGGIKRLQTMSSKGASTGLLTIKRALPVAEEGTRFGSDE
jgi:hypothetical protein